MLREWLSSRGSHPGAMSRCKARKRKKTKKKKHEKPRKLGKLLARKRFPPKPIKITGKTIQICVKHSSGSAFASFLNGFLGFGDRFWWKSLPG